MQVDVLDRQRAARVGIPALRAFVRSVAAAVPPSGDPERTAMALCLVSDGPMRALNRRFRGVDATTDVLSFPGDSGSAPRGERWLGDVVISVPRAREQAKEAGHSLAREIKLLALHGYLHLLGYDHERDDGRMMRLQRRLERRLLWSRNGRARA